MTDKLATVDVRLRCADDKHKKMCAELRDALLENFNNVKEAETADALGNEKDYCVLATAKINPVMRKNFEKDLQKMRFGKKHSHTVKAVKVEIIK